jgi:hypothetical protein
MYQSKNLLKRTDKVTPENLRIKLCLQTHHDHYLIS